MIGIDVTPLVLERPRGVARALRGLLEGLAQVPRPEPVVLFTPRDDDGLPALDGREVVPATSARSFRRAARTAAARADAFVSPWLASVRSDEGTLVWVHELPFVRLGPIEGRLRALRQRVWLRRHVRNGARFVVPSDATRRDLLTMFPEVASRVAAIAHGFDPAPWSAARREPAAPPRAVIVGTGRGAAGAKKKGIDLVPDLAARLAPDLALDVLGDEPLADDALRARVAGASVLICPSRSEGFGFPPLEAMACGVPVVCSDGGALPEVVSDAALVVPAGDAAALAEAARRAALDAPTRAALIERGMARARAFPIDAAARAWLAAVHRSGAVS